MIIVLFHNRKVGHQNGGKQYNKKKILFPNPLKHLTTIKFHQKKRNSASLSFFISQTIKNHIPKLH